MNKERQIQEQENKRLIDELSKMPPMVIATAYLHAINYTLYGEDVTEKWLTATEQAAILEKAYRKGYYDAMEKVNRERESQATDFLAEARSCGESEVHCNCTDTEIAKAFIEDVEAVKDLLPRTESEG